MMSVHVLEPLRSGPARITSSPARAWPVGSCVLEWRRRVRYRRMLRAELWLQADSVLADAGYTRADLRAEITKPFWRL